MTLQKLSTIKDHAYRQHTKRWQRIRKAAYPDTGGNPNLMHNWYRCSHIASERIAADALWDGERASWARVHARIDRWAHAIEHRRHDATFRPRWCAFCQQ